MPSKQISDERKAAYYIGMMLSGIGLLLFLSVFFTGFGAASAGVSGDDAPDADMPFDEKLRRLAKLHSEGILSDDEYARQKQKILDEQ